MNKADELYAAIKSAHNYVQKIGKPQLHFRDASVGKIHSIKVQTEINHQESQGETNYWTDRVFDKYLAMSIESNFKSLSDAALILMKNEADQLLMEEKQGLLERLDKIKEIEHKESVLV